MDKLSQGLASLPQGLASLPQGLTSLPNELILIIFELIPKITDKRQFLKTCNNYNIITKQLIKYYEDNFIVEGFGKINSYCSNKFALELCHDKYFDMIPEHYISPDNMFLIQALAFFGDTIILNRLVEITKSHYRLICGLDFRYLGNLYNLENSLSRYAILNNQLDVLIWIKNNYGLAANACNMAIEKGNLEILRWLNQNGRYFDKQSIHLACCYGNLPCIKFVYDHTYSQEWNRRTCDEIIRHGNIELLNWARENGCPV